MTRITQCLRGVIRSLLCYFFAFKCICYMFHLHFKMWCIDGKMNSWLVMHLRLLTYMQEWNTWQPDMMSRAYLPRLISTYLHIITPLSKPRIKEWVVFNNIFGKIIACYIVYILVTALKNWREFHLRWLAVK